MVGWHCSAPCSWCPGAGDYIEFQGAQAPPAGPATTVGNGNRCVVRSQGGVVTETAARWCGRWMALPADPAPTPTITYSAVNSGTTLCSRLLPFRLRVMFDDGEVRLLAPG